MTFYSNGSKCTSVSPFSFLGYILKWAQIYSKWSTESLISQFVLMSRSFSQKVVFRQNMNVEFGQANGNIEPLQEEKQCRELPDFDADALRESFLLSSEVHKTCQHCRHFNRSSFCRHVFEPESSRGGEWVRKHPHVRGSWWEGQTTTVRWRPGTTSWTFVPCTGSDLVAFSQQEQIETAGWIDSTFDPREEDWGRPDLFSSKETANEGRCCFLKL